MTADAGIWYNTERARKWSVRQYSMSVAEAVRLCAPNLLHLSRPFRFGTKVKACLTVPVSVSAMTSIPKFLKALA